MSIFGEAPIHKAVLSQEDDKTEALETIIEDCRGNVNNIDSNGWTPLHHAGYIGDYESAGLLVENGAKVNSYSNQQKTPLHLAAMNNHVDLVQALLINKAEMEW
jgi:ankyrin repeat protein